MVSAKPAEEDREHDQLTRCVEAGLENFRGVQGRDAVAPEIHPHLGLGLLEAILREAQKEEVAAGSR